MLRSFVLLLLVSLVAVEGIKRTLITANLFCHGLPHTGKAIVELWEFDSNSPDDYFDTTSMDGGSNSLAVVGYSDEWAVNDGNEYYLNIRHSCTNIGDLCFKKVDLGNVPDGYETDIELSDGCFSRHVPDDRTPEERYPTHGVHRPKGAVYLGEGERRPRRIETMERRRGGQKLYNDYRKKLTGQ